MAHTDKSDITPYTSHNRPLASQVKRKVWALVVAVLGWFILAILESRLGLTNLALVLLMVMIFCSYWLAATESLLMIFAFVATFDWFFISPRYQLTIENPEQLLLLAVITLVAVLVSILFHQLKEQKEKSQSLAQEAEFLRAWSEYLHADLSLGASTRPLEQILNQVTGKISFGFLLHDVLPAQNDMSAVSVWGEPAIEQRHALWHCLRFNQPLGIGTGRYEHFSDLYLPMRAQSRVVGAFVITHMGQYSDSTRIHLQAIADQFALTLVHKREEERQQELQKEREHHQLKLQLLTAISHDYRTPLASIMSASSTLLEQGNELNAAQTHQLLEIVEIESQRLDRVTTNVLQYARIETAAELIQLDWQSAEEIVGELLPVWRKRDRDGRLTAILENELPLFRGNAVLLIVLLDNLLDNAFKYSSPKSPIRLEVGFRQSQLLFSVWNEIPTDFSTDTSTPINSTGLGIKLCEAIARLHGGSLEQPITSQKLEYLSVFRCPVENLPD